MKLHFVIYKLYRILMHFYYLFCLILSYSIGYLLKKTNKNYKEVWLISERGTEARDNAYHLYRYIRMNHPEINIYYVIDKKSSDLNKVKELGSIVYYRSLKHHILFAAAEVKISTHIMGYAPDVICYQRFDKLGLVKGKKVFLQHGITKDDMTALYYKNVNLDLFICGAKPEYTYVLEQFGYPDSIAKYLGFCRFDNLIDQSKMNKTILFMPTWRLYHGAEQTEAGFITSEYYKKIQDLITNQELINFLEKNKYQLIFYPHYEIQRFLKLFTVTSKSIVLANKESYDVQDLLLKSQVLITDYSSVFFDFAYMGKPVIYYQFDEDEFRENHYKEGYFNYRGDGFGPVYNNTDDVVQYLIKVIADSNQDEYKERLDRFFVLHDKNNCERNYSAIKNLLEENDKI